MNKILFGGTFALGAFAILWIGRVFLGADTLGLLVTVLIGGVYAVGTWELLQFRRATTSLKFALQNINNPIDDLNQWLQTCSPSLQNPVRLRIEGERNGLPAPVLTPYLVGLLVMLGLLGTFVGMVDTLKGAVAALEGSSELEAIRAGLAAPIEGLGLAFGTSVAGVAASAMLGLLSTLSRRERLQVSQLLDTKSSQELRVFSVKHHQKLAFQAMQDQALALPAVTEKLEGLVHGLDAMSVKIGERLLDNQGQFQDKIVTLYKELNESVDHSLKTTLVASAELISQSIQPMAEKTLAQLHVSSTEVQATLQEVSAKQLTALNEAVHSNARLVHQAIDTSLAKQSDSTEAMLASVNNAMSFAAGELNSSSQRLISRFSESSGQWVETQAQLSNASEQQLALLNNAVESSTSAVNQAVNAGLAQQSQSTQTLVDNVNKVMAEAAGELQANSQSLLAGFSDSREQWLELQEQAATQLSGSIREELTTLRQDEIQRGNKAVAHLAQLETTVAAQLATLGAALEEPMTRLIETASQTPKAAADVIETLRTEMTKNLDRDNDLLSERMQLMEQLNTLSTTLEASSNGQREAIDALIERSAQTLSHVGSQFGERLEGESSKLASVVDHFASSSADMASLGDAFNAAVMMFSESNNDLVEKLSRIETALAKSTHRSDEQLAYYVAQAREIIDHNLLSHQKMMTAMSAQNTEKAFISEVK